MQTYSNSRNVYVIDTETTGLNGTVAGDRIVEVGIARVDIVGCKVFPEYSRIIDIPHVMDYSDAWVFRNTTLDVEDCLNSPYSVYDVRNDLRQYVDCCVTAYNRAFDIDKFLNAWPYHFNPPNFPCIMEMASRVVPAKDHAGGSRWPSAQASYDFLCPGNPARVPNGKEEHRALSDAVLEGYILLALMDKDESIKDEVLSAMESVSALRDHMLY